MKNKNLIFQIIWYFVLSLILSFCMTTLLFIGFFILLHITSYDIYTKVLNLLNHNTTVILGLFGLFLIIFVSFSITIFYYLLRRITNDIKRISENVNKIANGDFQEKISVTNNNELGQLANAINLMSHKIEDSIQKEKQFHEERYSMISNLSHDLKTPIMSINGYAQMIKDKKYKNTEELDLCCDVISRKSKDLNDSISQIFEFARVNSRELIINAQPLHVKEFTEQVLISYIPQLEALNMEYRIKISESVTINADPKLMQRVYDNIISNALKYAAEGKYLDINAVIKGDETEIHFINYGPQIAEDALNNIFNKYYREKENLKNEGNGLGLAIVEKIIELHHGRIEARSDKERTEFIILLS